MMHADDGNTEGANQPANGGSHPIRVVESNSPHDASTPSSLFSSSAASSTVKQIQVQPVHAAPPIARSADKNPSRPSINSFSLRLPAMKSSKSQSSSQLQANRTNHEPQHDSCKNEDDEHHSNSDGGSSSGTGSESETDSDEESNRRGSPSQTRKYSHDQMVRSPRKSSSSSSSSSFPPTDKSILSHIPSSLLFCLSVVGCAFVLASLLLFVGMSSQFIREGKVADYNAAVKAWNTQGYGARIRRANFAVSLAKEQQEDSTWGNVSVPLQLVNRLDPPETPMPIPPTVAEQEGQDSDASTSIHPLTFHAPEPTLLVDSGSDLLVYTPAYHELLIESPVAWDATKPGEWANLLQHDSRTIIIHTQFNSAPNTDFNLTLPFIQRRSVDHLSKHVCESSVAGVFDRRTKSCTFFSQLHSVCLRVTMVAENGKQKQTEDQQSMWSLDPRPVGWDLRKHSEEELTKMEGEWEMPLTSISVRPPHVVPTANSSDPSSSPSSTPSAPSTSPSSNPSSSSPLSVDPSSSISGCVWDSMSGCWTIGEYHAVDLRSARWESTHAPGLYGIPMEADDNIVVDEETKRRRMIESMLRIIIKETHDPYIIAQDVTQNVLWFGLAKTEKLLLSSVLCSVGFLFLLAPTMFLARLVKLRHQAQSQHTRRHKQHRHHASPFKRKKKGGYDHVNQSITVVDEEDGEEDEDGNEYEHEHEHQHGDDHRDLEAQLGRERERQRLRFGKVMSQLRRESKDDAHAAELAPMRSRMRQGSEEDQEHEHDHEHEHEHDHDQEHGHTHDHSSSSSSSSSSSASSSGFIPSAALRHSLLSSPSPSPITGNHSNNHLGAAVHSPPVLSPGRPRSGMLPASAAVPLAANDDDDDSPPPSMDSHTTPSNRKRSVNGSDGNSRSASRSASRSPARSHKLRIDPVAKHSEPSHLPASPSRQPIQTVLAKRDSISSDSSDGRSIHSTSTSRVTFPITPPPDESCAPHTLHATDRSGHGQRTTVQHDAGNDDRHASTLLSSSTSSSDAFNGFDDE